MRPVQTRGGAGSRCVFAAGPRWVHMEGRLFLWSTFTCSSIPQSFTDEPCVCVCVCLLHWVPSLSVVRTLLWRGLQRLVWGFLWPIWCSCQLEEQMWPKPKVSAMKLLSWELFSSNLMTLYSGLVERNFFFVSAAWFFDRETLTRGALKTSPFWAAESAGGYRFALFVWMTSFEWTGLLMRFFTDLFVFVLPRCLIFSRSTPLPSSACTSLTHLFSSASSHKWVVTQTGKSDFSWSSVFWVINKWNHHILSCFCTVSWICFILTP